MAEASEADPQQTKPSARVTVPPPEQPGQGLSPQVVGLLAGAGVVIAVLAAIVFFSGRGEAEETTGMPPPRDGAPAPPPEEGPQEPTPTGGSIADIVPDQVGPFQLVELAQDQELLQAGATDAVMARYEGGGTQVFVEFGAFQSAEDAVQAVTDLAQNLAQSGFTISEQFEVQIGGQTVGVGYGVTSQGEEGVIWTNGNLELAARGPGRAGVVFYESSPL